MSIVHVELPRPAPPPPSYQDVLVCDGCGAEGLRMDPSAVTTLPASWYRGWIGGEAMSWRIDLCPKCIPGAIIVLANEKQLHLEKT